MIHLEIQQALFGYSDGHGLIASSIRLTPDALRILNVATDLSGPSLVENFEDSVTGFPLPGTDLFALFRTWPAVEMSRPGCVWSHALFISFADLALIPDLSVLLRFFKRPPAGDQFKYDLPVYLNQSETFLDKSLLTVRLVPLLREFYTKWENGLIQVSDSSVAFEQIVFAIWSQQWPKLRRNFAFSTGSLSDRNRIGVRFDIQISPAVSKRRFIEQEGNSIVLFENQTDTFPNDPVLSFAVDDAGKSGQSDLRNFFREFGADVEIPRRAFFPLVRAFLGWSSTAGLHARDIELLVRDFPGSDDAVKLKRAVLDSVAKQRGPKTMRAFLTSNALRSFHNLRPQLLERFAETWETDSSLFELFTPSTLNDESTEFLAEMLSKTVRPSNAEAVWSVSPELARALVMRQPQLLENESAWRVTPDTQRAIIRVLGGGDTQLNLRKIGVAMLDANTSAIATEFCELFGESVVGVVADWTVAHQNRSLRLSERWRTALRVSVGRALKNELSPIELAVAAWINPEESRWQLSPSRKDVRTLLNLPIQELPRSVQVPASIVLTMIGLNSDSEAGARAIAWGIVSTFDVLARDAVPDAFASLVDSELPHLFRWSNWDKCRRLKIALARWVRRNPSLARPIVAAIRSDSNRELYPIAENPNMIDESDVAS